MNSLIEAHRSKYINRLWDLYNEIQEWRNRSPDNLNSLKKMEFNDFCDFCLLNSNIFNKQKKKKKESIEDETIIINNNEIVINEDSSSDEEDLENIDFSEVILNPEVLEIYLNKKLIFPKKKSKYGGYIRLKKNDDDLYLE